MSSAFRRSRGSAAGGPRTASAPHAPSDRRSRSSGWGTVGSHRWNQCSNLAAWMSKSGGTPERMRSESRNATDWPACALVMIASAVRGSVPSASSRRTTAQRLLCSHRSREIALPWCVTRYSASGCSSGRISPLSSASSCWMAIGRRHSTHSRCLRTSSIVPHPGHAIVTGAPAHSAQTLCPFMKPVRNTFRPHSGHGWGRRIA